LKKIVENILNGKFEYTKSVLEFSTSGIELTVCDGEEIEGSFLITGPSDELTEGSVSSSELRMEVLTGSFTGQKNEIMYRFNASGLSDLDCIKGDFRIISNHGEYMLPFRVSVKKHDVDSSLGEIKNLFHFANLAKSKWDEALKLFYSSSFHYVLQSTDAQYEGLYRGLSKVTNSQRNMEEFLIAINKKSPITYITDKKEIEYKDIQEDIDENIEISKNGWGFSYLNIKSDSDFIEISENEITEPDFADGKYKLVIKIHKDSLHAGENFGNVIICAGSFESKIAVRISQNSGISNAEMLSYLEKKKITASIMKQFIEFKARKINSKEWLSNTGELIMKMFAIDKEDIVFRMYATQYLITAGKTNESKKSLEDIMPIIEKLLKEKDKKAETLYAYFLYLQTLLTRQESDINKAAIIIEELYKRNADNWRIAYLLQYVSDEYATNSKKKWDLLKKHFYLGANSPLIYMDAIYVLRDNATLLDCLDDFETTVIYFAAKKGILTIPIMDRVVFLAHRYKEYNEKIYRILKICYDISPNTETLEAICLLLMKGERTDAESFAWYKRAVEAQLKILRLYEYYMMSAVTDDDGRVTCDINKMVLMYFSYQSSLPWRSNAILYRYMYEHRFEYEDIYESYKIQIEKFVLEQIDKEHISMALGFLYEHIITKQMIDSVNAGKLLKMLYMTEIDTKDDTLSDVIVVYDKCRKQMKYKMQNGIANLPLYGSEYTILFSDSKDNRYANTVKYSKKRFMKDTNFSSMVIPFIQSGEENLDLFLCELGKSAYTITMENVQRYRDLVETDIIRDDVRAEIRSNLIRFYYDNDFMRQLTEYLANIAPESLTAVQRGEMIELMVLTGMYDKTLKWLKKYGCNKIEPKIIMRLCARSFEDSTEDPNLLSEIAWYSFRQGKYDEPMLMFLVEHFSATSREMRDLYIAAKSYGVDTTNLLSRIIVQMLYTGVYVGDTEKLLCDYGKAVGGSDTEIAALAKFSYDYFVRGEVTKSYYYERIGDLVMGGVDVPDICKMAYLSYYADDYTSGKKDVYANSIIEGFLDDLISKNYVFAFYKKYLGVSNKMRKFADKTILEYRTNKSSTCTVHYMLISDDSNEKDYKSMEMTESIDGIYTAMFVLFFGEKIQYYITEEKNEEESSMPMASGMQQLTQSGMLTPMQTNVLSEDGRFNIINEMIVSSAMNDLEKSRKLAGDYFKNRFLVDELFKERR